MPSNTTVVDHINYVGIITLNYPDPSNTLTSETAKELNVALVELDNDETVRVIVIRSSGEAFCAGIDISEFFGKSHKEYLEWVTQLTEKTILVITRMKKPVIASAHGYCVAYGAGLIAACDLAIVAEGTKIGVSAINVGLFCMGPAVPLSRSLGRKRSLEMLMTGDLIDANDAERWGLINKVVHEDQLKEATMDLANKLAEKSPLALQMGKRAFYGMSDMEFGKALAYSNEVFASLCVTKDALEGVDAFLKGRKPVWKGK
jgi:enoyl-CoA hydratase/carnithine racemase